ncbi:MAG: PKD domain-containing protein, partial [Bacteroidales bacterium]|nr:PKD domain-containing protein [Bacteroidales bacterium]
MRKLVLFICMVVAAMAAWAQGAGNQDVGLIVNGSEVKYKLTNEDWNNDLMKTHGLYGLPFFPSDFGTPTSLFINAAYSVAWGDNDPGNDKHWFQYRIFKEGSGTPAPTVIKTFSEFGHACGSSHPACTGANPSDMDYIFKADINVNVIDFAYTLDGYGTYHLDVELLTHGTWTGFKSATFTINPVNMSVDATMVKNIGLAAIPYTFTAYAPAVGAYQWSINGTNLDGETSATLSHTFAAAGTYAVRCTVDGSDYAEQTVRIFEKSDATNKIVGGNMADPSKWAVASVANDDDTYDLPGLTWNTPDGLRIYKGMNLGNGVDRVAIYQPVWLEANKIYKFDCDFVTTGTQSNCGFELFVTTDKVPETGKRFASTGGIIPESEHKGQFGWGAVPADASAAFVSDDITISISGMYFVILRIYSWHSNGFDMKIKNLTLTPKGTWLGRTTDWGTATNWSGGIPDGSTDVVIPTGSAVFPVLSSAVSANAITFEPGTEIGYQNNLTLTTATVQYDLNYEPEKFRIFSMPLGGVTVGNFSLQGSGGPAAKMLKFNASQHTDGKTYAGWIAVTSTGDDIDLGTGFAYGLASHTGLNVTKTLAVTGTLPKSDVSVTIPTGNDNIGGTGIFTVVGNPFMSSINYSSFATANTAAGINSSGYYVWDGAGKKFDFGLGAIAPL